MGSSRAAGSRLLGFLGEAQGGRLAEALRALNLESLAGRPIEDIFLGLADFVCPAGGTIDEGIARDAFFETIADLVGVGITDLNALNLGQVQVVFELYACHAIEARLCNDIATKSVTLPADTTAVRRVQEQLHGFIQRGVSDALTSARATLEALTPERALSFVENVYATAFEILRVMGEEMS
jgi:hypothetical protein